MTIWIPYVLLFITFLAFCWRTYQLRKLSTEFDIVRRKLIEEGGELQDTINFVIHHFDGTLYYYRDVIYDRPAMEALALDNLAEDLRVMSKFVGFGESVGWGHAFNILANYRVRLIVGRVALSVSASEEFKERVDKLVDNLKVFEMLRGFRRTNTAEHAPYELANKQWPDLQVAQSLVVDTQEQARNLMKFLEQDQWKSTASSSLGGKA